jgi:hypothetical protein
MSVNTRVVFLQTDLLLSHPGVCTMYHVCNYVCSSTMQTAEVTLPIVKTR